MKVSLNLIRQFWPAPNDVDALLELVGGRLGEIEGVEDYRSVYDGISVAVIKDAQAHPDADKLGVYEVEIAPGQTKQVVAGDTTLKPGDKVAYIAVGATVPATKDDVEPLVIAERDLRGQTSQGMLASLHELALGDDHSGVLVLDSEAEAGTPLAEVYDLADVVFEIENKTLTHRPDCFGHIGIARELAGISGQQFTSPDWYKNADFNLGAGSAESIPLVIEASDYCQRFTAAYYTGVKVGPSPLNVRGYLQRLGVRPVNNVVDATNLAMLITGQPLHAYDYDKLSAASGEGARFVVRTGGKDTQERLQLLDGTEVEIDDTTLVIATDNTAVGLAGIMGGAATEVDEQTTSIVVEAATFDMYNLRATAMKYGLQSEALTRFARGQPIQGCLAGQTCFYQTISQTCDIKLAAPLSDSADTDNSHPGIVASADYVNGLLGTDIKPEVMAEDLRRVELDVVVNRANLDLTTPWWRRDLNISADIAEEIGRLRGYESIKPVVPTRPLTPAPRNARHELRRRIRSALAAAGGNELSNYSGVSARLLEQANQDKSQAFVIHNALSPQLQHLRLSLLPSLLEKVYPNLRQGYGEFALFELERTQSQADRDKTTKLPLEHDSVALVLAVGAKSQSDYAGAPYYAARRYLAYLMEGLGLTVTTMDPTVEDLANNDWLTQAAAPLAPGRRALVRAEDKPLGVIGEFTPGVIRSFKLPKYTAGFELRLDSLQAVLADAQPDDFNRLVKFPKVRQDVTFKTPAPTTYQSLRSTLVSALESQPYRWELTDLGVFQGEDTTDGTRNISFHLTLQDTERTLEQRDANAAVDAVVAAVESRTDSTRI